MVEFISFPPVVVTIACVFSARVGVLQYYLFKKSIKRAVIKKKMMMKNLIEPEDPGKLKIDSNGNFTHFPDKNGKSKKVQFVTSENYVEDKTSSEYIPKSYRSQSWINRVLTGSLELFGVTFLQPIKWKNVLPIAILHLLCLYIFMAFPVFEVKVLTVLWGE